MTVSTTTSAIVDLQTGASDDGYLRETHLSPRASLFA